MNNKKYEDMYRALTGNYDLAACELVQMVHVNEGWTDGDGRHVLNRWFGLGYSYYESSPEGGTLTVKRLLGGLPRWRDIAMAMFRTDTDFTELNLALLHYGKARLPQRTGNRYWKVSEERGMSGRRDLRLLCNDEDYQRFGMEGRMLSHLHLTGSGGIEGDIPFSDFPCYATVLGPVAPDLDAESARQHNFYYNVELVEWNSPGEKKYAWEDGGVQGRDWTDGGDFSTPFDKE